MKNRFLKIAVFVAALTFSADFMTASAQVRAERRYKELVKFYHSSSFSPIASSATVPSFFTTTPCKANGSVTHWYFLIPP